MSETHPLKKPEKEKATGSVLAAGRPSEKAAKKLAAEEVADTGTKARLTLWLDTAEIEKIRLLGVENGKSMSKIISGVIKSLPEPSFKRS